MTRSREMLLLVRDRDLTRREGRTLRWQLGLLASVVFVTLFFLFFLSTIVNNSFGLVASRNEVDPSVISPDGRLNDLGREQLLAVLSNEEYVSSGLHRRLDFEKPLDARSVTELRGLVEEHVINPTIVMTWSLSDSLTRQTEISAYVAAQPGTNLSFRSWLNSNFIFSHQSPQPDRTGIRAGLLGSFWIIVVSIVFAFPLGVCTAIYLQEYAGEGRLTKVIRLNIQNLASFPTIIYGLLGLAMFVRVLDPVTSGTLFGVAEAASARGRTVLSAGLTLGLIILPIIIINAQEAFRAIPASFREACFGVGARKWRIILERLLPYSFDRLLTIVILAISRVIGETAPLFIIGAATVVFVDPEGLFARFTTLPVQAFYWSSRPQPEYQKIAAAAILLLLLTSLVMNITIIYLRNRIRKTKGI